MKILLDANLSWKLVKDLAPIYGVCVHVDNIGLKIPVSDTNIWKYALDNGFIIITKDCDFIDLLDMYGFPPKIVLIRTGNNSSKAILELLIKIRNQIDELENSEDRKSVV